MSKKPVVIKTVLGSCISVCLWDKERKIGGINHFVYPFWDGDGLATPQYGNVAMKGLVDAMVMAGSMQRNMIAKVFGGAMLLLRDNTALHVGQRNLDVCKHYLRQYNINIMAEDTGGNRGRSILFCTNTGEVLLKRHAAQNIQNPCERRAAPG